MSRAGQLAMVHIARKDLGWTEETYRDVMFATTGKESAKALTPHELNKFLDECKRRGWKPKRATRKTSAVPQVRKVWQLWKELCESGVAREPTRAALRSFVKRMTGVADPEWLSPEQAGVVIEALKAWKAREAGA